MQTVTTIGLDIAKSVFQLHGVDAGGQLVIRRKLKRYPPSEPISEQSAFEFQYHSAGVLALLFSFGRVLTVRRFRRRGQRGSDCPTQATACCVAFQVFLPLFKWTIERWVG